MTAPLAHPTREELSAFALGKLPEDSSATIEHHLAECDACSATLAGVADDTLIGLLFEPEQPVTDEDVRTDVGLDPEQTAAHAEPAAAEVPEELAKHPRYRVLRLLGRGGMGDVYLAEHRLMERPVAIKVMKQRLMGRPDAVERFRREVRAAAQLMHENIVTAYDAEQAGDLHLLVMEYVDGHDLATEVKNRRQLPVREACEYARQTALGLAHAHAHQMVHRDIKPHNLMLVDGQVKILDFGLAQVAQAVAKGPKQSSSGETGSLTSTCTVLGTPDYIAPEQIQNAHAADHRADIYSLGATLYFLLTGRPPFSEGSATERIESHLSREPADIRDLRPDLPKELAHVIRRLMAKSPENRYPSAEAAAEALAPFCGEQSKPTVSPTTASSSYWNWAVAPLLAALFAGGAWGFWQIVVTIRDQDGNVVSRSHVPQGGSVEVGTVADSSVEDDVMPVDEIARQANACIQAALRGDAAGVAAHTVPEYSGQLDDFRKLGRKRLTVDRVWADAEAALAITEAVTVENPGGEQEGRLVLTLEKRDGKWLVRDVDFEMDASLEELKRFRNEHPDALERGSRPRGASSDSYGHPGHPQGPSPPGAPPTPSSLRVLGRHQGAVYDVTFSPDGGYAATAGSDETIRVWNIESGREIARFDGHRLSQEERRASPGHGTVSVAFAPDGRHVLSGGWDGTGRLWELTTGEEITHFGPHSRAIYGVDLSPDGTIAATAHCNWQESTDQNLNQARLWDVETGELLYELKGHEHGITGVSFSPDGRWLATSSPDATVRIWDVETGKQLRVLEHATKVHEARFSPDGRMIAAACAGTLVNGGKIDDPDATVVVLWDAETGERLRTFRGHRGSVKSVDFSPDGGYLVSASGSDHLGGKNDPVPSVEYSMRVWDVETGEELLQFSSGSPLNRVRFSPDGSQIIWCGEHTAVRLWELPEALAADRQQVEGRLPIRFSFTDDPIAEHEPAVDGDWAFEVEGDQYVRLFEVESPGVEDCIVSYRAKLRTEDIGRAYLEMWVRMPDGREAFSKGIERPIQGTTGWASYQIPFFLQKGERPDLIKLGITIEGGGTIWVEDVELTAHPAP